MNTDGRVMFDNFEFRKPRTRPLHLQLAECMRLMDDGAGVTVTGSFRDVLTQVYVLFKNEKPLLRGRGYEGKWGKC